MTSTEPTSRVLHRAKSSDDTRSSFSQIGSLTGGKLDSIISPFTIFGDILTQETQTRQAP